MLLNLDEWYSIRLGQYEQIPTLPAQRRARGTLKRVHLCRPCGFLEEETESRPETGALGIPVIEFYQTAKAAAIVCLPDFHTKSMEGMPGRQILPIRQEIRPVPTI